MSDANQPTFYWLDYETFGTDPARDKACQFAGIRTDMDFNIIGEPLVIYCQPTNDYLPAPEASLITGISPQLAMAKGLTEPEFIAAIHKEISTPNTCTVGYNNVRFDDEVTRHLLYRNFYDPYAWAWKNQNSRWDLLDVLRTCYALRPEGIEWPVDEETGNISFKLEKLSVENGIEHANAHDAMADVIATIEMAKRIKKAQPKLFSYLFELRNKKKVQALLDPVNMTPVVHVSGMLGSECSNISWMVPLVWHPTNANAMITINLAKDISPLFELDADALRERLYTKHSDLGENELPVPIKLIHINKCPIVAPAKTLTASDAERLGVNREYCLENLQRLKSQPDIREKLLQVYSQERVFEGGKPESIDATLYDGFFSQADRTTLDIIRETAPEKLGTIEINVADERIAPLLFQYRARHFPETLSEEEQVRWQHRRQAMFEEQLPNYINNLENLAMQYEHDSEKIKLLEKIYRYVESIAS